jgi:hypothetical protein
MANHYWIRRVPELTLADLADRLDKRLSPPLKCSAVQPAPWLSPRLVVHGGGRAGATMQLRQGPQATLLSINRVLVSMPLWMRFMPPILRYLLFMGDDAGAWAAVRSFVLESGEFVGPAGGKPRRLFRPGRIWMLGNPALFQLIGTLKLLVGLGLAGFCLYVCAGYDDALPVMAIVAALGGRWIYTGIANLRLRIGSFLLSLVPLVLTGAVAWAVGYASPPIRHHFDAIRQEADLEAQRQKVLAGGPVREYAGHVSYALHESRELQRDPQRTAKLGAQLAEAVKIMVRRNVFLHDVQRMIESSQLPDVDQAKRTNGERIKKLRDLIDRKYNAEARAREAAVRLHNYALDESGTPRGTYGKYHVLVRPPDRDAEGQLVEYLEHYDIRVEPEWVLSEHHFADHTEIGVPNDCDPAKVKGLLALNAPKADAEPQWAELDRKETVLHTDDPESPCVIVPAQYVRSLAQQLGHSADLKWDESLYRQGKVCVQFTSLDPTWYDSFRHDLEAWKPTANLSDSTSYPWP